MLAQRRVLLPIAAALLALPLAGMWLGQRGPGDWASAPPEVRASLWPEPRPLEDFSLLDQHAQPFGPERLRGEWSLLFFGYMQCPDVCPTTLSALREMRGLQQRSGGVLPQVVFVSLDPEFDTPEAMAPYLNFFDASFVGAAGSLEALQPLTSALHIMRIEQNQEGAPRSIDHTSSVIVVDPEGRAVGALSPPHQPAALLARFEALRGYLGG